MNIVTQFEDSKRYLLIDGPAMGQVRLGVDITGQVMGRGVPVNDRRSYTEARVLPLRVRNSQVEPQQVTFEPDGRAIDSDGVIRPWDFIVLDDGDDYEALALAIKEDQIWLTFEKESVIHDERREDLREVASRMGGGRPAWSNVVVKFLLRPTMTVVTGAEAWWAERTPHHTHPAMTATVIKTVRVWHEEPGCKCDSFPEGDATAMSDRLVHHAWGEAGLSSEVRLSKVEITNAECAYCD